MSIKNSMDTYNCYITVYNFSQIARPNFMISFYAVIVLMVIAPLHYLAYIAICWTLSHRIFVKILSKRFQTRRI